MAPQLRECNMNDAWGYDDNSQEPGHNDGPKALRDAYAALKKQNEDLINSLNADRAERQKERLSSVFSELGVPGAVDLYQGEPDPEKAKAWALSMQATFGTSNAQAATSSVDQPVLDDQTRAAYEAATQAGATTGTPMGSHEAAALAIQNATTMEELIAANLAAQHLK